MRYFSIFCMFLPLPVYARGTLIDVVGLLYLIAGLGAIVAIYYFWMFLFGLIVLPFTYLLALDKKLNESLATFALCGFVLSSFIPIIVVGKSEWYWNALVLLAWFFTWYALAKFIQYKVEVSDT
jgi:hypothetical protein